jgi:hypothetical protein
METRLLIVLFVFLSATYQGGFAQKAYDYVPGMDIPAEVRFEEGDTVYEFALDDVDVLYHKPFKDKEQEKFFAKMVRDVKAALPYAKIISAEMKLTNKKLYEMKDDKQRKKFLDQYEKEVFKKYEANLKKLTISQGRILLKLIDRECEQTSYELVKIYRGTFSAFFWQGMAKLFGSTLKSEYDPQGADKTLERIIILVEAGKL